MFGIDLTTFLFILLFGAFVGILVNAGTNAYMARQLEVLSVEIKRGNKGRWRWYVRDPRTARVLGQCPVRGYPTPQTAEGVVRRILGARITVTIVE